MAAGSRWRNSLAFLCLLSMMVACGNSRKNWVLVLSGAKDYKNYSLQSMVFHACHTVMNKGIPKGNMIHMNYNDIAHHRSNPVPGNLVTLPGNTTNWWPGCHVDYAGGDVQPEVFLKVLSGDKEGVREILGHDGPVIESGPDDHIFLYMADHGAFNLFCFPNDDLWAPDFERTLEKMHREKKFAKMVIYMEACQSSSMFVGFLKDNLNVMAITSASPREPAHACCFDDYRLAYTSGYFDNAWLYDSDNHTISEETIQTQFDVMKEGCLHQRRPSHVEHHGDSSILKLKLSEFQAPASSSDRSSTERDYKTSSLYYDQTTSSEERLSVPSYLVHLPYSSKDGIVFYQDIDLANPPFDMLSIATPARSLMHEKDPAKRKMMERDLLHVTEVRRLAEEFFTSLVLETLGEDLAAAVTKTTEIPDVLDFQCYRASVELFRKRCPGLNPSTFGFVLRHYGLFIQMCNLAPADYLATALEGKARRSSVCWSY